MSEKSQFILQSEKIAFDLKHRETIRFNISRYNQAVAKGKERYSNLDAAKQKASCIKEDVVLHLDKYLTQFEQKATENGIEVLWAKDDTEAIDHVIRILQENEAHLVVKSKSMISEEIEFNHHVEKIGIESVETDLGEFIVQVAGEKPYHIVTPAMHKSRHDIAALFHDKFNTPEGSSPEFLTKYVRGRLREKFTSAQVGVTGANFLIADTGAIALTENEGNAMMSVSFPKIHIAITGIEKLLPSFKDLALFWPLLSAHGTGQQITVYNSMISGPKKEGEIDGPEKMFVILLDNGRTEVIQQKKQYQALKCIRCGACLNACPIYKNIGGYTYASTYSGPIGSVLTPYFKGFDHFGHLSSACSVCGACSEVCPVKIPLHDLLLENRWDAVRNNKSDLTWDLSMKGMEFFLSKRFRLDLVGGKLKNLAFKLVGKDLWSKRKEMPTLAEESFSKQWKRLKRNRS
ncbi:MAG: LutB/LldF family L-lactate oxidation iron-sulfur protein [Bacteroidota bacterium]|nr:LutB/LldF family L-lactate oxidation iron-sulfur protein [Bacteroidota bacterium]